MSRSMRSAWIEMLNSNIQICDELVALHAERVD